MNQRVGVLGGTFDPVHMGHLLLAEIAREQLDLETIRWLPAALAPHPQLKQSTESAHRLAMVRLAICGNDRFIVDDRELRRGGHSFTVDSLAELQTEFPGVHWILLMGADSLQAFPLWREPHRICELSQVVVVTRGGEPPPDLSILARFLPRPVSSAELLAEHSLRMPQLEISSSEIRRRVGQGRSIRYMVPAAVGAYIEAQGLYNSRPD